MSDQSKGIKATCGDGHEQTIYTPDADYAWAQHLAGLMDGTSDFYRYPPSSDPKSAIARCGICGALISCSVFGYKESGDYQGLIPEPEVTGTKSYDMKIDWVRLNAERMATLNPIKKLEAVAYLRKALASDMPKIRGAIAVSPQDWWSAYHMWWGMSVRNALRKNGFGEIELGVDNLDDYYIGLVELAAGDSK